MTNTSAQEIRRLLESIQIDETHPAQDHTHPQHELAAKARVWESYDQARDRLTKKDKIKGLKQAIKGK